MPVHVEPGRFVSLFPAHQALNVQVTAHPAFESREQPYPTDSLLFADLQTSLYTHISGRLGSGRAGFFRGWYLKGVGRTPLAANWNNPDYLHNSGHMTASSAIREYVVSRYLREQGAASSIVSCEGVLLAELEPALHDYNRILYQHKPSESVPVVDRHLQAITVKRGEFARLSNLTWLLHHLTPSALDQGRASVGMFGELLAAALTPPDDPSPVDAELTAERLASLFAQSIRRAAEHFETWFARGVWWGSFNNNATMDGRFLDLETPFMLAGPCFGCLSSSEDDRAPQRGVQSSWFGIELMFFLSQTQLFCAELRRVLGNLPRAFGAEEREFAADLANEIERQVCAPDQLLGSRELTLDWVYALVGTAFGRLPPADDKLVRALVAGIYDQELGDSDPADASAKPSPRLLAVPGHGRPVTEPGLRWRPFALELSSGRLLGPSEEQCRTSQRLAELVTELDHTTSLPRLMDKLAELARRDRIV